MQIVENIPVSQSSGCNCSPCKCGANCTCGAPVNQSSGCGNPTCTCASCACKSGECKC